MSDFTDMNDEEFMEFIMKNKGRIKAILSVAEEETSSAFSEGGEKLKEEVKSVKDKIESKTDKIEENLKAFRDAFFSKDVQKHIIGAGMEFALGISAFLEAIPKSERAQEFCDKADDLRRNAAAAVCAKNPYCSKKNTSERKEEIRKIEID